MTTPFTVVIPSRFASTRLPGKPLQMIAGKRAEDQAERLGYAPRSCVIHRDHMVLL